MPVEIPLTPELKQLQDKLRHFIINVDSSKKSIHFWSARLNSDKTSTLMVTLDANGVFITSVGGTVKGASGALYTIDEAAELGVIFSFVASFVANPGKYVRLN